MGEYTARRQLAENLKLQRLLRGWSQEELAERAELDRSYVGGIERGQRNVSLDTLAKLSQAFGLTISDLLQAPDPTAIGERLLVRLGRSISSLDNKEPSE